MEFDSVFGTRKPVIGMLHVPALPGSPQNKLRLNAIIDWVLTDAEALAGGGTDGLILENFGDVPFYPRRVPPHTVAYMTTLAGEVRRRFKLPLGINILRNDPASALAVSAARAAGCIRGEIPTGGRVTDAGIIQGKARKNLPDPKVLGGGAKKF